MQDEELEKNSRDMEKYGQQPGVSIEKFNSHSGRNVPSRQELAGNAKAEHDHSDGEFEDGQDHRDETDWPTEDTEVIKPYFRHAAWYEEWGSQNLIAYRIPGRSQEEIDEHRAAKRVRHIVDIIDPELLRALRQLRKGELRSNDKIFKTFCLHEIKDALRHGSRAMHILLARTMNDGFGKTRRELETSAKN